MGAIYRIPLNPTWDAEKREIEIFTGYVGHPLKGSIEFEFLVAFDDVPIATGEPVLPLLDYFAAIVEDILYSLEAEAKRLGIFK